MATIYRFVVEQKLARGGDGRTVQDEGSKTGAAKKGRKVSLFGGEKGGVEHNRKLRAINPLLNKITGGAYERGMRVGRAAMGLIQVDSKTGAFAGLSFTAISILVSFVIQALLKWQRREIENAERQNAQNFKQLENGFGAVSSQYKITSNFFTGRYTYNQNK
jgi:hypothetical protein